MPQIKALMPSALGGRRTQTEEAHTEDSGTTRRSFRILSILTALWVLAMTVIGLLELVVMWLPADVVLSIVEEDDPPGGLAHRAHWMSIGTISWALVLSLFAQLRKPERREAQMLLAMVMVITGSVVFALSGTVEEWLIEELTLLAPVTLLALLHPRAGQLAAVPAFDRAMMGLAGIATVPWLTFAFTQAQEQWRNLPGDVHAEPEHWALVALMAVTIVAAALIGATDRRGWRLTAWIAALASANYGLHSLVFPEPASAVSTPWAVAAVAWGVGFAVAIVRRQRRTEGLIG